MKPTLQQLAEKMADKTDQELLEMFKKQSDWSDEAIAAAKAEFIKRNPTLPSETENQQKNPFSEIGEAREIAYSLKNTAVNEIANRSRLLFIQATLRPAAKWSIFWGASCNRFRTGNNESQRHKCCARINRPLSIC